MERRAALEKKERAKKGREHGGKSTPEQAAQRKDRLEAASTSKRPPKDRSRRAVAKQARVSERKLRIIREIRLRPGFGTAAVATIRCGEKTGTQVKREIRAAERTERIAQARQIAATPDPARCMLLRDDLAESEA